MKDNTIIIEPTTKENASGSWKDPEKMIERYPYHAKLKGIGGGYFENIEEIKGFYSRIKGAEKITGYGEWEVENGN